MHTFFLIDLYERTVRIKTGNIQILHSELVYEFKYQIWCKSVDEYVQDLSTSILFIQNVAALSTNVSKFNSVCLSAQCSDLTYMGGTRSYRPIQPLFNTNQRMGNKRHSKSNREYQRRTDRHSTNNLDFAVIKCKKLALSICVSCHKVPKIEPKKNEFGEHLISSFRTVNWPLRSCDLTHLDYFL